MSCNNTFKRWKYTIFERMWRAAMGHGWNKYSAAADDKSACKLSDSRGKYLTVILSCVENTVMWVTTVRIGFFLSRSTIAHKAQQPENTARVTNNNMRWVHRSKRNRVVIFPTRGIVGERQVVGFDFTGSAWIWGRRVVRITCTGIRRAANDLALNIADDGSF